jgi:anthranilate synthase component 1
MNKSTYDSLAAQGYTHIPLAREVLADLETPLTTYLKLADAPYSYLFESVQGGEKWGRFSFIGLPCRRRIRIRGTRILVENEDSVEQDVTAGDPLTWIDRFRRTLRVPRLENLPRFHGGLVGYFGYDTVRYIEPRLGPCPNPDDLDTPDIVLMVSEELVVFDNLLGKLQIIVHADTSNKDGYERAQQRLQELVDKLARPYAARPACAKTRLAEADFKSGFGQRDFERIVEKARRYIIDGDIMQAVLAQRSSVPFAASSLDVYRALRTLNPSPYMYFLNLKDFEIAGSSPEILARVEDGDVTVRPIAGTRRRGHNPDEDRGLEQELLRDPKELAEHLMLIDLGRNDIGRVCRTGTVKVTEKMVVERYSHVMHIVSNVTGRLREGLSPIDVLRATFPAGTLTGAAKVRAMEIIDELEIVKRGVYGGAIGYIGWTGNMDTAIAIRTAVIKNGVLYIQAGAGIVYDSIPELEWQETLNKSRAVFRAAAMAATGLGLGGAGA